MQIHHRLISRATVSFAALGLLLWTGCSTSKTTTPATGSAQSGTFDKADANHDGKLSRTELSNSFVNQVFDSRDANHDGKMTQQEWTAGDSGRTAQFKKRDTNGDGVVTKQEAIAYGAKHGVSNEIMNKADKNHDGYLNRDEAQTYYSSIEDPVD